jgi:hypothetical protein
MGIAAWPDFTYFGNDSLTTRFVRSQPTCNRKVYSSTQTFIIMIVKGFLPKYLRVVLQNKYHDKISEIRIEGHTNPKPTW